MKYKLSSKDMCTYCINNCWLFSKVKYTSNEEPLLLYKSSLLLHITSLSQISLPIHILLSTFFYNMYSVSPNSYETSSTDEVSHSQKVAFSSTLPISWLILSMVFVAVLYLKLLIVHEKKKKRVSQPSSVNSSTTSELAERDQAHVPYQRVNLSSVEYALDARVTIADQAEVEMPSDIHWMPPSYESLHSNAI